MFGSHPNYKFVFVNHVTTNPFFMPTQYGAADACKLLGCTYQWTGSEISNVNQMVNAMNTRGHQRRQRDRRGADRPARLQRARRSRAEGRHPGASPTTPTREGNTRLSYIGQDLKLAGEKMGERIVAAVPLGRSRRCSSPRPARPTCSRASKAPEAAIKASGKPITVHTVATGAAVPGELSTIDAYWVGPHEHEGHVRGRRRLARKASRK